MADRIRLPIPYDEALRGLIQVPAPKGKAKPKPAPRAKRAKKSK